jgi:hypothetical protein
VQGTRRGPVLTVRAPNSTQAVAGGAGRCDPDGRAAMAVARTQGVRTEDRIVAVDSSRLAAVARMPGQDPAEPGPPAAPAGRAGADGADGPLTLGGPRGSRPRRRRDGRAAAESEALWTSAAGRRLRCAGGRPPHLRGRRPRLRRGVPAGRAGADRAAPAQPGQGRDHPGVRLTQPGGGLNPAALADVTRWRPPLGPVGIGTIVTAHQDRLALSLYTGPKPPGQRIDPRLMVNAAPAPAAGRARRSRPNNAGPGRPGVGAGRVAGAVPGGGHRAGPAPGWRDRRPGRPRVRPSAATTSAAESAALEVWLTADAPGFGAGRLRERGCGS